MKAIITRNMIDGSWSLRIAAESDDDATLVDALLANWQTRRTYVSSAGGPVFERRPNFTVNALPDHIVCGCDACKMEREKRDRMGK